MFSALYILGKNVRLVPFLNPNSLLGNSLHLGGSSERSVDGHRCKQTHVPYMSPLGYTSRSYLRMCLHPPYIWEFLPLLVSNHFWNFHWWWALPSLFPTTPQITFFIYMTLLNHLLSGFLLLKLNLKRKEESRAPSWTRIFLKISGVYIDRVIPRKNTGEFLFWFPYLQLSTFLFNKVVEFLHNIWNTSY